MFLNYKSIKRNNVQFKQNYWKINMNMNFFTGIFQRFCLLFRNTNLNEHLWAAASLYYNREASQGSIYFLGDYYSREYLNMKILHSKLFQGEYLFPGGSIYLLVNKYWGSNYCPLNNYWRVLFSVEYLLTVTSACQIPYILITQYYLLEINFYVQALFWSKIKKYLTVI